MDEPTRFDKMASGNMNSTGNKKENSALMTRVAFYLWMIWKTICEANFKKSKPDNHSYYKGGSNTLEFIKALGEDGKKQSTMDEAVFTEHGLWSPPREGWDKVN